jgi:hypothetical protein
VFLKKFWEKFGEGKSQKHLILILLIFNIAFYLCIAGLEEKG